MAETKEEILQSIKDYTCHDYLNLHDPSVGIYAIGSLDAGVIEDINDPENGVTVTSYTKESAIIDCEVCKIELFINEYDKWDARIIA